jgi:hypothetical protein
MQFLAFKAQSISFLQFGPREAALHTFYWHNLHKEDAGVKLGTQMVFSHFITSTKFQ